MTHQEAIEKLRWTFPKARWISISTDTVDFLDKEKLPNRYNTRIQIPTNDDGICGHFSSANSISDAVDEIVTEHIYVCN
jgi:hypothetical protein